MKHRITHTLVFILLPACMIALLQAGVSGETKTWKSTFGGPGMDYGTAVVAAGDGGYVLTGAVNLPNHHHDIVLIKTDGDGNQVWMKTFGGNKHDAAKDLIRTSDGGYAICGWTESYRAGFTDLIVIRTDAAGNALWQKTYHGPREKENAGTRIRQTADGGFVVIGDTSLGTVNTYDICLIKIDAAGGMQWRKTFGTRYHDEGYGLVVLDDGYVLAGAAGTANPDDSNVILIKVDLKGNKIWEKTYGGNLDDIASYVARASDGGFIIAGRTKSYGAMANDILLVKTDAGGIEQWHRMYGGKGDDFAANVIEVDDGYVIGGSTDSDSIGDYNLAILKVDTQGNLQWQKTYGGNKIENDGFVARAGDRGFVLIGSTHSYGKGAADIWLIKTDTEGGTDK